MKGFSWVRKENITLDDYSLITDITESVKKFFDGPYADGPLMSGDSIREKVKASDFPYFDARSNLFKGIPLSDIIMGYSLGNYSKRSMTVIFSKNKFCVCSNYGKYKDVASVFNIDKFASFTHQIKSFLKKDLGVCFAEGDGTIFSHFDSMHEKRFRVNWAFVMTILDMEVERVRKEEIAEKNKIKSVYTELLNQFDKDNNGIVDIVESNDLQLLLKEHQEVIRSIDQNYLQKFVKVSSWLVAKKQNIQQLFNSIKTAIEANKIDEKIQDSLAESLHSEVHVYEQVLFNSLNMISALIDDDMLTFYEIENVFDNLNMFDSKLEKDISEKLSNIGDGLNTFVKEMNQSSNRIIESVQTLTYVTAKSNERLEGHLKGINSSLQLGNMINSINAYQNWSIKKKLL